MIKSKWYSARGPYHFDLDCFDLFHVYCSGKIKNFVYLKTLFTWERHNVSVYSKPRKRIIKDVLLLSVLVAVPVLRTRGWWRNRKTKIFMKEQIQCRKLIVYCLGYQPKIVPSHWSNKPVVSDITILPGNQQCLWRSRSDPMQIIVTFNSMTQV